MMTKETKQNYTDEQTNIAVQDYQAGKTIEEIAQTLGKTARSVVAKLSREGVYKAKTKLQTQRLKKADMVDQLAIHCGVAPELFESLEKANYDVLEMLVAKILS